MALKRKAVSQMAACGTLSVRVIMPCMPPRNKTSSANPVSRAIIKRLRIKPKRLISEVSFCVTCKAASSCWRNHVSSAAMDSGKCKDSFQATIRFMKGIIRIMLNTAQMRCLREGLRKCRKSAASVLKSLSMRKTGSTNTNTA